MRELSVTSCNRPCEILFTLYQSRRAAIREQRAMTPKADSWRLSRFRRRCPPRLVAGEPGGTSLIKTVPCAWRRVSVSDAMSVRSVIVDVTYSC
jgi:hypothetical protein